MKVDERLIRHVAEVARLRLTPGEVEEFLPQLQEVLDSFSKISMVDTEGTKPSFQPVPLKDVLREDKAGECLNNEGALGNTGHKKDGYFKGPRAA